MFQPLNLFKFINCPSLTQTNNNTITCERPYCQFKHPKVSNSSTATSSVSVTKDDTIKNNIKDDSTPSTSNVDTKLNCEGVAKNLPNILENLTSALQSVQKLISSSNISDLSELANDAAYSEDPNKINSSLATLTNAINSLSSNKTPETKEIKSPINSLKRQQLNAPDYNPTPIKDLKNNKKNNSVSDCDKEDVNSKRQKKIDTNDNKPVKRSIENSDDLDKISKVIKTEKNVKDTLDEKKTVKPETKSKTDVVSFAKLTLSQQVQKRYEMLNKTPPTPISLAEARLKKMQASLGATSKSSTTGSKTSSTSQKVPRLIIDNTNKIPLPMRQRYLTVIFENGRSTLPTLEKACEKAAEQEKSIYDRAKNKTIYTNLAANLIRGLRTAQQAAAQATGKSTGTMSLKNVPKKPSTQSQSHEAMLNGAQATRCSFSINRVKQIEAKDLSVVELYRMFCTYVMTEEQLETHSFPKFMQSDTKNKLAMIPNFQSKSSAPANKLDASKKQNSQKMALKQEPNVVTKLCKRCSKTFMLSAKDIKYLSVNSECVFHWGKLRNVRVDKSVVQKYNCCNGGPTETGCEVGKHVYEGTYDGDGTGKNLTGYVETKESTSDKRKTSGNIYALDCEMCYTTKGLEVTRVSVVDIHMKEVYESLVKPDTQILDYNTRWSGLTEKILKNCNKSLKNVQEELLKIFNKDTILIGHSLDSDFKSLKLVHKKVIDTSVVFPHKLGLPYKRALRNLMSEHLQKIIQEDVQGHDSKEDANSCIALMMWKINEDLKNPSKLAIAQGKVSSTSQFSTAKSKTNITHTKHPSKTVLNN